MTTEGLVVVGGVLLSAGLYSIAYLQVRRRFPARATEYLVEALTTAVGASVAAWAAGYGPVMWAIGPGFWAAVGFLAGKGSVAVLVHDERDGTDMPAETARARKRFGVLCVLSLCVLSVVVIATE